MTELNSTKIGQYWYNKEKEDELTSLRKYHLGLEIIRTENGTYQQPTDTDTRNSK